MSTGGGGATSDLQGLDLAGALADGVVLLGPDARVLWANRAFTDLLGAEPGSLDGEDGLGLVHPDELARAMDGLAFAQQFPGRTSVAAYRVRRADGGWQDVELKSGVVPDPAGDRVVLVVRDGTNRQAISRALRSVASGAPFAQTAGLVCEAVVRRWPGTGAAVSLMPAAGEEAAADEPVGNLPEPLLRHAAGCADIPGTWAPWELGGPSARSVVVEGDDLGPLGPVARAAGFEACAIARVEGPGGEVCCLTAWFAHAVMARLEFAHAAEELAELLLLALERRHHQWQLSHLLRHDPLTGLLNRIGFYEEFEASLRPGVAPEGTALALLFLDLDDLKVVNDRHGHAAGDRLLCSVAERLTAAVGADRERVARLGGDEFVVAHQVPVRDARRAAEALASTLAASLRADVSPHLHSVGVSIGIAIADVPAPDALANALERADAAMYRAKAAGKGRWSY